MKLHGYLADFIFYFHKDGELTKDRLKRNGQYIQYEAEIFQFLFRSLGQAPKKT